MQTSLSSQGPLGACSVTCRINIGLLLHAPGRSSPATRDNYPAWNNTELSTPPGLFTQLCPGRRHWIMFISPPLHFWFCSKGYLSNVCNRWPNAAVTMPCFLSRHTITAFPPLAFCSCCVRFQTAKSKNRTSPHLPEATLCTTLPISC